MGQGTTAWLGHSRDSFRLVKQGRYQIFPDYWKASGDTVSNTDHNSSLSPSVTAQRGDLSSPRSVAELEPGFGMEQDSKQTESCFADVPTLLPPCHAAFTSAPAIVQLSKESVLGCGLKCQYSGSSGKSWVGGRVVSKQLTGPRPTPSAALTVNLVHLLPPQVYSSWTPVSSQVTEPLPAESQALLSTASAL